jgi:nitrite reductase/ring-hydroxylating ferredoxin subunit
MSEFVTVARVGEIREGRGRTVTVGDRLVAVFCVDATYYALDDYCPHMGASLGEGTVRDGMVICDAHLFSFDLRDGTCPDAPGMKAETFEVRVQGDEIQVRVPLRSGE